MAKKILIVEDEPVQRKTLRETLMEEGYEVFEAVDGEEGLAMALKEHPDLILLDLAMPKLDGLSMTDQLRKDSWGKDVKIVILTNLGDVHTVDLSQARDIFHYLIKANWTLEDVAKKVRDVLAD